MTGWLLRLVRWILFVPFLAGLTLGVWVTLRLQPAGIPYWRQTVLDRTVESVMRELPSSDMSEPIAVLPLRGDADGCIRQALFTAIKRSGKYRPVTPDLLDRMLTIGSQPQWSVAELPQVVNVAQSLGVKYALFGDVGRFEELEGSGADLQLVLRLADVPGERSVWMGEYHERLSPDRLSLSYIRARLGVVHGMIRVCLWLAFVALLPVVLLPALRGLLRRESNAVSLAAWLSLTAVAVGVAVPLIGSGPFGWGGGLLLCLAGIMALGYNLLVMGEVARVSR